MLIIVFSFYVFFVVEVGMEKELQGNDQQRNNFHGILRDASLRMWFEALDLFGCLYHRGEVEGSFGRRCRHRWWLMWWSWMRLRGNEKVMTKLGMCETRKWRELKFL